MNNTEVIKEVAKYLFNKNVKHGQDFDSLSREERRHYIKYAKRLIKKYGLLKTNPIELKESRRNGNN